jgi:hypothetical protein
MTLVWSEEWLAACSGEIARLEQQDTWTLVPAKTNNKILTLQGHFLLETDLEANVASLKAQFVV